MTSVVYDFTGAKEFPFPHPVRVPSQITVEVRPGGVVPPTEYDVIGYGPGATGVTIRWPGAPGASSTAQLIISRYVEPERVTEFSDDEGVTAGALNAEFDNAYRALTDFSATLIDRVDTILEVELPLRLDELLPVLVPPMVEEEVGERLPYDLADYWSTITVSLEALPPSAEGSVNFDPETRHMNFALPAGPQGAVGPRGPEGPSGSEGPMGPRGPRGPQGEVGPQGIQGPPGAKGETGPRGPQGEVGPRGPQGIQGPPGEKGEKGDKGDKGDPGPEGPQGPRGNMGSTPLGLAFGRFHIDAEGDLIIEYYGSANDNDFRIDADGYMHVSTVEG